MVSSPDPLLAPQQTNLILPIEVMKQFQSFALNPEVGYIKSLSGQADKVFYGLAASKEVRPGWELVGEFFGITQLQGDGSQVLINLGTRYDVNQHLTLLFAAGHTVENFKGDPGEWITYLGVQLKLWRARPGENSP